MDNVKGTAKIAIITKGLACILAALLTFCPVCHADKIVLKNGSVLEGEVVSEEIEFATIKTEDATIRMPKSMIKCVYVKKRDINKIEIELEEKKIGENFFKDKRWDFSIYRPKDWESTLLKDRGLKLSHAGVTMTVTASFSMDRLDDARDKFRLLLSDKYNDWKLVKESFFKFARHEAFLFEYSYVVEDAVHMQTKMVIDVSPVQYCVDYYGEESNYNRYKNDFEASLKSLRLASSKSARALLREDLNQKIVVVKSRDIALPDELEKKVLAYEHGALKSLQDLVYVEEGLRRILD